MLEQMLLSFVTSRCVANLLHGDPSWQIYCAELAQAGVRVLLQGEMPLSDARQEVHALRKKPAQMQKSAFQLPLMTDLGVTNIALRRPAGYAECIVFALKRLRVVGQIKPTV